MIIIIKTHREYELAKHGVEVENDVSVFQHFNQKKTTNRPTNIEEEEKENKFYFHNYLIKHF